VLAASPLLSGLLQSLNPSVQQETKLLIDLQSCPADDRPDFVMSVLAEMLAEVLRLPGPETVSRSQSLFDLGLDSILALELTNRISTSFGRPFRATLFFTCQTLAAVADHILAELSPVLGGSSPGEDSDDLSEEELSQLISEEISR
jgi:acyl carrier protein